MEDPNIRKPQTIDDLDSLPLSSDTLARSVIDAQIAAQEALDAMERRKDRFVVKGIEQEVLRPRTLDDIVGQPQIQQSLAIYIEAAMRRESALDHVLLTGPGGLGKTTIAKAIAHKMRSPLIELTGPGMKRDGIVTLVSTLAVLFDQLRATAAEDPESETGYPVVFIDEVHGMRSDAKDALLPILEDFQFMDAKLPPFTVVAATTDPSKLSGPFRDRFAIQYQLDFYPMSDIERIARRSLAVLLRESPTVVATHLASPDGHLALDLLVRRARGVPRLINTLLKRTIDFMEDDDISYFTSDAVQRAMMALRVDIYGLGDKERRILELMVRRFKGNPVGVRTLGAALGESAENVELVIEPALFRGGLIDREQRGRTLTDLGRLYAIDICAQKVWWTPEDAAEAEGI